MNLSQKGFSNVFLDPGYSPQTSAVSCNIINQLNSNANSTKMSYTQSEVLLECKDMSALGQSSSFQNGHYAPKQSLDPHDCHLLNKKSQDDKDAVALFSGKLEKTY